jgi:hypothetical protein
MLFCLCPEVGFNCHEGVYWNASAQRSMGDIMDRYRGQRRSTNVMVRFSARPATIGIGRVLNVSATGAFMETQLPLRLLSVLYLEPMDQLPTDGTRRIAATVVRCSATGVGLEWCEFAAEATMVYACLATGSNDLAGEHQLPLYGG